MIAKKYNRSSHKRSCDYEITEYANENNLVQKKKTEDYERGYYQGFEAGYCNNAKEIGFFESIDFYSGYNVGYQEGVELAKYDDLCDLCEYA